MTARKYRHVAVLMGGLSAEREVSLNSGAACSQALEAAGYRVTRIDAGRDLAGELSRIKPEVCFNALHGRWGEDGCVQGLLEVMGIPYTHSGVLASAAAMHKEHAKTIMRAAGVPVPEGRVVSRREAAAAHALERPYVLKPVSEGSSVGVFIVTKDHGASLARDVSHSRPHKAVKENSFDVLRGFERAVRRMARILDTEPPRDGVTVHQGDARALGRIAADRTVSAVITSTTIRSRTWSRTSTKSFVPLRGRRWSSAPADASICSARQAR